MVINLYNFTKRRNSTAVPSGTGAWNPDVNLKAPTDSVNPSFLLASGDSWEHITSYNYCKMGSTYYFIDKWKSVRNDLWEAECELDALATYRSSILATTAFVEYDTAGNTELVDTRLPVKSTPSVSTVSADFGGGVFSSSGTVILTVTGKGGSVQSFATSLSVVSNILNDIHNWVDTLFAEIVEVSDAIIQFAKQSLAIGNAPANIRSCVWIPWTIRGTVSEIYLGEYDTGYTGYKITSNVITFLQEVSIPWQFSDWRNASPYTAIYLYVPFIGMISIPASTVKGQSSIKIQMSVDQRQGDISCYIYSGEIPLGTYGGSSAVAIPVGVSNVSIGSITNSIGGTLSSLAMGNLAGAGGALLSGMSSVMSPNQTTVGGISNASGSGMPMLVRCCTVCHNTPAEPSSYSAVMGTPTGTVKQIGGLSGYVKTHGASVSAPCGANVLATINTMLDGGIYIV